MDHIHKRQVAGIDHIAQVVLVDQSDGVFLVLAQVDDGKVVPIQGLGAIADEDHQVRIFHSLFGSFHAHGFDTVPGFPDTCGVDEPQSCGAYHNSLLHGIPGGTCNLGDDDPLIASQGIEKAGLAHVGLADDGGGNAVAQDSALSVGAQQGIQGLGIVFQGLVIVLKAEIFDIFVGIIQNGMKMTAQIHKVIINGGQFLLQHAAYLACGVGGGVGRISFDQVDDGLCLSQVQMSVEEGTFCEFAPLGRLRSGGIKGFQSGSKNSGRAVAMKFYRVLAGVAVGSPGVDRHALIQQSAGFVVEGAQHQAPVGGLGKGSAVIQFEYLVCDDSAVITGQADDADGGNGGAGGHGSDGV